MTPSKSSVASLPAMLGVAVVLVVLGYLAFTTLVLATKLFIFVLMAIVVLGFVGYVILKMKSATRRR